MIQDWYDTYRKKVDSAITEYFQKRYNTLATPAEKDFQEAVEYAMDGQWKRIRVILSMIIYEELMGLPSDVILEYLIGIEFIYAYSIVHEDLPSFDHHETHWVQPTVWKKYGEGMWLLVGDALHTMGIEILAETKNPQVILEITKAIGDMGMVRGKVRDMLQDKYTLDQKEIIRLHDEKTGKFFIASLLIGAAMAGIEDPQTLEQLKWFGVLFGRAFQIRDDILFYEETLAGGTTPSPRHINTSIVTLMGIEKARKLLQDLEYTLLETANTYQTSKFSDIVTYIAERAKAANE